MKIEKLKNKIDRYHFELWHITILLIILIIFQFFMSLNQKSSLRHLLEKTQNWYQQDSAERLANLTTTSLELLVENVSQIEDLNYYEERKIIQSFDIIFSQQLLQQNVKNIFLIIPYENDLLIIENGIAFYNFLIGEVEKIPTSADRNLKAVELYSQNYKRIEYKEQILTKITGNQSFNIFVPFIPNGELIGVLYMKNKPDFSFITNEIISSYDDVSLIYSSLMLLGLIAVYFISSHTVKERNRTQEQLFEEKSQHLKEQIEHEKESLFTKRIYHTHHKAEKIMGFIKEDLRELNPDNTELIKKRVSKYSSFISRVIYDMKWYDPPITTIRNRSFRTNINEVIKFVVNNVFLRITTRSELFEIKLDLDNELPVVYINEFVLWEIIEPLIQNSIDHSPELKITIVISTKYYPDENQSVIRISDDGKGIDEVLLEKDKDGVKKIFRENITTAETNENNKGYGTYLTYEITKRCGWYIDAYNNSDQGCTFEITIPN